MCMYVCMYVCMFVYIHKCFQEADSLCRITPKALIRRKVAFTLKCQAWFKRLLQSTWQFSGQTERVQATDGLGSIINSSPDLKAWLVSNFICLFVNPSCVTSM